TRRNRHQKIAAAGRRDRAPHSAEHHQIICRDRVEIRSLKANGAAKLARTRRECLNSRLSTGLVRDKVPHAKHRTQNYWQCFHNISRPPCSFSLPPALGENDTQTLRAWAGP